MCTCLRAAPLYSTCMTPTPPEGWEGRELLSGGSIWVPRADAGYCYPHMKCVWPGRFVSYLAHTGTSTVGYP